MSYSTNGQIINERQNNVRGAYTIKPDTFKDLDSVQYLYVYIFRRNVLI